MPDSIGGRRAMQADELKAIRKGLGWTQAEMAEAMGLTPKSIGMMERGDAPIEKRTELAALYLKDHPEAGA